MAALPLHQVTALPQPPYVRMVRIVPGSADILQESLNEESRANKLLTDIADRSVNVQAKAVVSEMESAAEEEEEEEYEEEPEKE